MEKKKKLKKKWKRKKKHISQVFKTKVGSENQDKQSKNKITSVIIAATSLTCVWAVLENFSTKTPSSVIYVTLVLAAVFVICGVLARCFPAKEKVFGTFAAIVISVIFTYYTVGGFNEGFSVLWAVVVPYAMMTVVGLLDGTIVTAYLCGMFFVVFWTPVSANLKYAYPPSFCLRFPVLFFLCAVVSLYTNYKLQEAKLHQMKEKQRLQVAVDDERLKVGKVTMQTIISISNAVDAKDSYTKKHSERVAKYSKIIANELRWTKKEQENLYNMALLHDIGKIGVPDAILKKHGQLTDEEFPQIRKHPIIGGEILKDFTLIEDVSLGAFYHHERYDGKGYPFGLKGEEIPVAARIIGIADSIDAMNSDRVYRGKKDTSYILDQLEQGKGTQFDPNIDEIVIALIKNKKLRLDIF